MKEIEKRESKLNDGVFKVPLPRRPTSFLLAKMVNQGNNEIRTASHDLAKLQKLEAYKAFLHK